MRVIPFAVLLTLLINAIAAQAEDRASASSLKGLPGVNVVVETFFDQAKSAGFDEGTFQTDVELKLRLAGIKVLTEAERLDTTGGAFLYLSVNPLHEKTRRSDAYAIRLALYRNVRLSRNDSFETADTWSTGMVGRGSLSNARDSAKDQIDKFINAWLSVNPK